MDSLRKILPNMGTYRLQYEDVLDYSRLSRIFGRGMLLCTFIVFIGELMTIYFDVADGTLPGYRDVILPYAVIPTAINLFFTLAVNIISRFLMLRGKAYYMSIVTILGATIMCFSLMNYHYWNTNIFAILIIPVISSLFFIDKKPIYFALGANQISYLIFVNIVLPTKPDAHLANQGIVEQMTVVLFIIAIYFISSWILETLSELVIKIYKKDELIRHDVFTNLLSHSSFYEELEKHFPCEGAGDDQPLSLVMLDIDDFKQINDAYGHQTGDDAILYVAGILQQHTPLSSKAFRFGGDEFAMIYLGSAQQAAATVHTIKGQLHKGGKTRHAFPPMTLSVGISQYDPMRHGNSRDLLTEADYALYEAKRKHGKNAIVFGDAEGVAQNASAK